MSSLTISKSYAVLAGLEVYGRFHRAKKRTKANLKEKTLNLKDTIQPGKQPGDSAREADTKEKERILAGNSRRQIDREVNHENVEREERQRDDNTLVLRIMRKLRIKPREPKRGATAAR